MARLEIDASRERTASEDRATMDKAFTPLSRMNSGASASKMGLVARLKIDASRERTASEDRATVDKAFTPLP